MALISLIHPSRGRAEKSFNNSKEWIEKAGCDVELIVSIDRGDDGYFTSYKPFNHPIHNVRIIQNDNKSAVDAINKAAKAAKGDILIVVSDDSGCFDNWGSVLLQEVEGKNDWILKTDDGIQQWIITMPIMDRLYYERFNYIYYPEYLHMFCDTELTCVADLTGRKLVSKLKFPHNHYSVSKSKYRDSVSEKADSTWKQGEDLFVKRYKGKFNLQTNDIVSSIESPQYIAWINSKI